MKKLVMSVFALVLCAVMASCSSSSDEPFSAGTLSDTAYSSDWLDFTFTAGEGITLSGQDELVLMMESAFDGEVADKHYEMMATGNVGETVLVTATQLNDGDTVDGYLDALETQFEALGYLVTVHERTKVDFMGARYESVQYTVDLDGLAIEQLIYVREQGGYIVEIYFTYTEQSELDALLACFEAK